METQAGRCLIALSALLAATAGCSRQDGPPSTQTRTVDAFHSIELQGAATVDVLVGERQSVVVEGNSEALERLTTQVSGERLAVRSDNAWLWQRGDGALKVRITLPELRLLEVNGAGRISVNGPTGGATTLVLSGAGEIEAAGRLDTLTARLNGAGKIDLSRLQSTDAEVTVNGAGQLKVNVTHRLDATLNGVGTIEYSGNPTQVNPTINGVGSIRRH
jgi:hypothetical protein